MNILKDVVNKVWSGKVRNSTRILSAITGLWSGIDTFCFHLLQIKNKVSLLIKHNKKKQQFKILESGYIWFNDVISGGRCTTLSVTSLII